MDSLALKYRPQRFEDLVGQQAVQVILRQMVATGQVPHALLFEGSRGTGKTTTARILAAALNCERRAHAALRASDAPAPCGLCVSCKSTFDGTSLDVVEIDAASNGLVDDIRALRQQVLYRTGTGTVRVVILDEAHSMSPAAFNALLKTLEEPPPSTVFLLLTTERHRIPDTVASRCMPFTFRRLTVADIVGRLSIVAHQEDFAVEEPLLALLAEEADGAMRDALMLLDQVARVGMATAEQYQRLIGHADHAPAVLAALAKGDLPAALGQLDLALTRVADPNTVTASLISVLRDVLVLRCGGEITKTGFALAERQNLALALETPTVVNLLKVLWQVRTQARLQDARSTLELAVVMLSEVFGQYRTPNTPAAPQRMTFSQIANFQ